MADMMADIDSMISDNDEEVETEDEDEADSNLPPHQRCSTPTPGFPGMAYPLKNPQLGILQEEARRSRSRSPSQERQGSPFRRNGQQPTTAQNTPSRARTNGNGFVGNGIGTQLQVPQNGSNRLGGGEDRDKFMEAVTSVPFKFYLIVSLIIVSFYANYHLRCTTHDLQEENRRLMADFQIQLHNLKSDFADGLRKHEAHFSTEMEDLRSELATMTTEIGKLMKKITLKQMENENSSENQSEEPDDYYSRMLKYVRIKPEVARAPEQLAPSSELEKINIFREQLKALRSNMRAQMRQSWIEIYSGIVGTFSPGSTRPAAIVLLIPPQLQYTQFATCFARKLAGEVNYVFNGHRNTGVMELSSFSLYDASLVSQIHEDFHKYFDHDGGRAVLIHNLEQIQKYEILMVFHAFCDNIEAYQKQATFIFTVNVPERIYDNFESEWKEGNGHRITRDILHEAWENVLSLDKRSALIARLAVNTILVQEGDSCL